jgi:hypothetical protein
MGEFNPHKTIPSKKPDEKEDEAAHEVIRGWAEDFELILFDNIIKNAKKRGISRKEITEMEAAFDEYMQVSQELYQEHGGDFSIKLVYKKIPQNKWVQLMAGTMPLVRAALDIPEDPKEFIRQNPISDEIKASFRKDVKKRINGEDVN